MIDNLGQAESWFKRSLPPHTQIMSEDRERDYATLITTPVEKFCVTFKREYYKAFGDHFGTQEGYGQIANKRLLVFCANYGYIFVMVMPDSKIYAIDAKEFIKYYLQHKTDVPHLDGEIACRLKMFRRLYAQRV